MLYIIIIKIINKLKESYKKIKKNYKLVQKIHFKCLLKLSIEELDLIPNGIEFHSPGAATANVLSP